MAMKPIARAWIAVSLSGHFIAACGGPTPSQANVAPIEITVGDASATPVTVAEVPADAPHEPARHAIEHEPCDLEGPHAKPLDLNGDGHPDVIKVVEGLHEICRASDFDGDGKPDQYDYFSGDGSVRRTERDLDGNGKIDEVTVGCVSMQDVDGDGVAERVDHIAKCGKR
jgi:hypothetical protein